MKLSLINFRKQKIKSCDAKQWWQWERQKKQRNNSKKKQTLHVSTLFVHNSLSLFCMSKPRNFLVTHFMEKMSYFLTKHYFCCLCSCSFFFFTASHFSSCWPLAFLIFSLLQLLNFHVILPAKFFFFYLFFISPTSSFCDIHVSVHIKM